MRHFTVYSCPTCGQVRAGPSMCSYCEAPLMEYRKDDKEDYKLDTHEALRLMRDRVWYV
jgi:hypothetical protein